MSDRQPVIFPSRTGKTFEQQRRIRAALLAGETVLSAGPDGTFSLSLAADRQTIVRTPTPSADPAMWRFDATTGEHVNIADPTKRVGGYPTP